MPDLLRGKGQSDAGRLSITPRNLSKSSVRMNIPHVDAHIDMQRACCLTCTGREHFSKHTDFYSLLNSKMMTSVWRRKKRGDQ